MSKSNKILNLAEVEVTCPICTRKIRTAVGTYFPNPNVEPDPVVKEGVPVKDSDCILVQMSNRVPMAFFESSENNAIFCSLKCAQRFLKDVEGFRMFIEEQREQLPKENPKVDFETRFKEFEKDEKSIRIDVRDPSLDTIYIEKAEILVKRSKPISVEGNPLFGPEPEPIVIEMVYIPSGDPEQFLTKKLEEAGFKVVKFKKIKAFIPKARKFRYIAEVDVRIVLAKGNLESDPELLPSENVEFALRIQNKRTLKVYGVIEVSLPRTEKGKELSYNALYDLRYLVAKEVQEFLKEKISKEFPKEEDWITKDVVYQDNVKLIAYEEIIEEGENEAQ